MKIDIALLRDGMRKIVTYEYEPRQKDEKPMVLDVLLQAQATSLPDLAFRYGCRARNCGVCTVDINGRPRIACRARVREGDVISPMGTLPALSDLVVRRDGIARQLRGRVFATSAGDALNKEAPKVFHDLTACIECYACLEGCPMHLRNFEGSKPAESDMEEMPDTMDGYQWGNPFSLLKLERSRLDPVATEAVRRNAVEAAIGLGLDACVNCAGCKCGIGINLKNQVIAPLLAAAGQGITEAREDG
ncbi:MAG: 2Fe-2S iron-sulfur cluster-binding protein [Rhodospirillales bacterium]